MCNSNSRDYSTINWQRFTSLFPTIIAIEVLFRSINAIEDLFPTFIDIEVFISHYYCY